MAVSVSVQVSEGLPMWVFFLRWMVSWWELIFKYWLLHIKKIVEDMRNRLVPATLEESHPSWSQQILMLLVEVKGFKGSHFQAETRVWSGVFFEINCFILFKENEDASMISGAFSRKWGEVVANLLSFRYSISRNITNQPMDIL